MNQWINESVIEWISGYMNQWTNESVNQWTSEWVNGWVDKSVNQWTNEWKNESMIQWINEPMSQWIDDSANQWINELRVDESGNQWIREWRNEWMDGWMKDWMDGAVSYSFVELLLHWTTFSLRYLFSQLFLFCATSYLGNFFWPCSELPPICLFCSFCNRILLFAQLLQCVWQPPAAIPHSTRVALWSKLIFAQLLRCV